MRRSKRLMAFLMSVMMFVSLVFNGQLSGGYMVYAEEEVASDTDAAEMTEDATGDCEENVQDVVSTETEMSDANFDNDTYVGDNYEVTLTLDSYWDSGYNATVTIKNTGDTVIQNWCVAFPLEQNISNIWNASIEEVHEDYFVIKNVGWNQDIAVGGSVSFGITCYEAFSVYPEYYTLLGNEVELASGDYSVAYEITEDWGEGYKALVTITNNKSVALEDWRIKFNYGDNVITQIWDAVIVDNTDGFYEISCESYNQNIVAGGSVSFEFLVEPGSSDAEISEIVLLEHLPENNINGVLCLFGNIYDKVLELKMICSEECIKYEIFASYDGQEYVLVDYTDIDEYNLSLTNNFRNVDIYVRGYIDETSYIDSTGVSVKYADGTYILTMQDTDGEGLEDCYELYYGTDINLVDTDGDNLDDYYEVYCSFTHPFTNDSDENGITDDFEDYDEDGLTTYDEYMMDTDPVDKDTDDDHLEDGEEKIYATDVLLSDSDYDGLSDGDEIVLGTDPLDEDSDDDGILDGDESFEQSYTYVVENEACAIDEVTVTLEGIGCLQNNTTIESVMGKDYHSSRVVGLFGEPFEIETSVEFSTACLSFKVDKTALGDVPFENLMFLWYDEENGRFVELETILDEETGTVSTITEHFSKYMLVDKEKWFDAWSLKLDYSNGRNVKYNTVLCIDVSGSMAESDPIKQNTEISSAYDALYNNKQCDRIKGGNKYISLMTSEDQTAIVFFSSSATVKSEFTNDKSTLRMALQKMYNSGGTSFDSAIQKSVDLFSDEMINDPQVCNRIILISDGQSSYSLGPIREAASKNIQIYTIGLGSYSGDSSLKAISEITGATFAKIYSSDDLEYIYEQIYVEGAFDTTDTDGDGLYDVVEKVGIRLIDGTIIYTDPDDDDSDDDKLLDGEEINPVPRNFYESEELLPGIYSVKGYGFEMYSDPTKPDTDGDGASDKEDATPRLYNEAKSYIFNSSLDEYFLKHEANTRYLELRYVYGENVDNIVTDNMEHFIEEWNKMGINSEGKITHIIDEVHLIYHGSPCWVRIEKHGRLWTDSLDDCEQDLGRKFNCEEDITVDDLNQKSINYLNLSSCNNGNLDFTSPNTYYGYNMAITFLKSKHNINKVTAWDGSSVYHGTYVYWLGEDYVISHEYSHRTDEFDAWSLDVNGWERKAEQQVTYWIDRYGNVVWDKEKHRID